MPVILNELERIKMAQIARGATFKSKSNLIARARSLLPLLIPTISLSIMRANELAVAMETRGYRVASKRTRYYDFKVKKLDFAVILVLLLLTIIYLRLKSII